MKVDKKFVGLFFALVLTSGCGLSIGDDNTWDVTSQTDTGVTVEAVGTVEVVPDGVQFNFSVFAVGPTSVAATQSANVSAGQVRLALDVFNVAETDIATQNIEVYPEYSYAQDGKQTMTGFRAMQSFAVTLRSVANSGAVVDEVVRMVGTNLAINVLSATLLDTEKATAQAREKATALALKKAETYADLLDVELGAVISVKEYAPSGPIPQPWSRNDSSLVQSDKTVVNPGTQEVSLTVQIRWALKD